MAKKDISYHEQEALVRAAFYAAFPDSETTVYSCIGVYDDYLVVSTREGEYYRVEYSADGDGYAFTPREQWARVEREWIVKAGLGVLVQFGGDVKALGDGKFRAPLVQFGSPDTADLSSYRDFFTKDTDFGIDWDSEQPTANVLYHHGLDARVQKRIIGKARLYRDDVAVWMEGQLTMRDEYERAIYQLIEAGKMGTSSGALTHLVERVPDEKGTHWIKTWRGIREDASLTPCPADYRNLVMPIKALEMVILPDLKSWTPEAKPEASANADAGDAARKAAAGISIPFGDSKSIQTGETNVTEKVENQNESEFDAKGAFLDLDKKFTRLMELIENSPAVKSAGFITVDGGAADPQIKSLADFVIAVRRGDMKRIETVYQTKAVEEGSGASAGVLIPQEYRPEILQLRDQSSPILALVSRIPTTKESGRFPVLDQAGVTPDGSGQTAYAAGLQMAWTPENGDIAETELAFEWLEWHIKKLGGLMYLSNESMSDAPMLERVIRTNVGLALAAMEEYAILRGNGVGMPLGFLNSPAAIPVSPDSNGVFAFTDATEMYSRFRPQNESASRWIAHKSLIEDLGAMEAGTGVSTTFIRSLQDGLDPRLWGIPVVFSQHLPKRTNSGDVLLADLSLYLFFDRQQPAIAFSEHFKFGSDQVTFRVTERLDGAPWLSGAISDANPQGGFTESPIVYFND